VSDLFYFLQANLYGIEPHQAVGRKIYEFLDPQEVDQARDMVASVASVK
jgi:hypothetical protein